MKRARASEYTTACATPGALAPKREGISLGDWQAQSLGQELQVDDQGVREGASALGPAKEVERAEGRPETRRNRTARNKRLGPKSEHSSS